MSLRIAAKVYLVLLPLYLCAALAIRGRTPGETPVFAEFSDAEQQRIAGYIEPMIAEKRLLAGTGDTEALWQVASLWRDAYREGRLKTTTPLEIGARSQVSPVDEINQTLGRLLRKVESAATKAEAEGSYSQAANWALMGFELAAVNRESTYLTLRRSYESETRLANLLARVSSHLAGEEAKSVAVQACSLATKEADLSSVALRMGLRQSKQLMSRGEDATRTAIVKRYKAISVAAANYDVDGLTSMAHREPVAREAGLEIRLAANTAKGALNAKQVRDKAIALVRRQLMTSLPSASS